MVREVGQRLFRYHVYRGRSTRTMAPVPNLNFAILGHHTFEVFNCPLRVETLVVGDVLDWVCSTMGKDDMKFKSDFWLVRDGITILGRDVNDCWLYLQLKEPIPFNEVKKNPWLLDPSTDLEKYGTRHFRAERLFDTWNNRDHKILHAVVRMGV